MCRRPEASNQPKSLSSSSGPLLGNENFHFYDLSWVVAAVIKS